MSAMLSTGSLQPPKMGTSRWSKALPEIPAHLELDSILSEYEDISPSPPPTKELPKPPPRTTSIANSKPLPPSLPPSLPPLHLLTIDPPLSFNVTPFAPPSAPPKMSIPRRPVGRQPVLPPPPPPALEVPSSLSPHSYNGLPSPSESLSSILSAYSHSSGESLVNSSSSATITAIQNESNLSPSHQAPLAGTSNASTISPPSKSTGISVASAQLSQTQQQTQQQTQIQSTLPSHYVPPKPVVVPQENRPPPLPSKDTKYFLPASPAPNRARNQDKPVPPMKDQEQQNSGQQSQPQIWRRRSLKADLSLEVPDLKLVSTNGSTAASQPAPSQTHQQQHPPATTKASNSAQQQPRNTHTRVASGQDSQPARASPVRISEQAVDNQTMGNNSSKLDRFKDKLHLHRRGKSSNDSTKAAPTQRPGAHRPPTPEYQQQDMKTPIVDTFVSPLSPATSPEPGAAVSPELPRDASLPSLATLQAEPEASTGLGVSNPAPKPIVRKAIASPPLTVTSPPIAAVSPPAAIASPPMTVAPPTVASTVNMNITENKKLPEISKSPDTVANNEPSKTEFLPPISVDSPVTRGSAGSDSGSGWAQISSDSAARHPPRLSSVRSNAQLRPPPMENDPRMVRSDSGEFLYRGRDGTLYREMKMSQEPLDPRFAYFPKQLDTPIPEGTVLKAPVLKQSHFQCYQEHRTMNRRTNKHHPLSCQTCDKSDVEDRWTCSFCHLRICESCLGKFNNTQRDLSQLSSSLQLA